MQTSRGVARAVGSVFLLSALACAGAIQLDARQGHIPQQAAFERVTIRTNDAATGAAGLRTAPAGRIEIRGMTLRELLRLVYGPMRLPSLSQIVGGPAWLDARRFDIEATGSDDMRIDPVTGPSRTLVLALHALLAERFKLEARRAFQEQEIYALVPAEKVAGGPGLKPRAGCQPPLPGPPQAGAALDTRQACNVVNAGPGVLTALAVPMPRLAQVLTTFPGISRLVRDESRLSGIFDVNVTYAPSFVNDPVTGAVVPNPDAGTGPTIFEALEQQLGLKLETRRSPVEVVIVEHAEMPS
jgi:uncharacterized protein (TIGR03435 family)